MAKQQVFADKGKRKPSFINVKVIQGYRAEANTVKYMERFVRVNEIAEVEKIDIVKQ
jgi:hypothetical protein